MKLKSYQLEIHYTYSLSYGLSNCNGKVVHTHYKDIQGLHKKNN